MSEEHQQAEDLVLLFTSGFQPLMFFSSADGKLIHGEFKPGNFFSPPETLQSQSTNYLRDHRPQGENHKICLGRGFSSVTIVLANVSCLHQQFYFESCKRLSFWNYGAIWEIQPLFLKDWDQDPQKI